MVAWSPDCSEVITSHTSGSQWDVVKVKATFTHPIVSNLTAGQSNNDYPGCWTPDGKYILYVSNLTGNYDLWAMKPDGSGKVDITAGSVSVNAPVSMVPTGS